MDIYSAERPTTPSSNIKQKEILIFYTQSTQNWVPVLNYETTLIVDTLILNLRYTVVFDVLLIIIVQNKWLFFRKKNRMHNTVFFNSYQLEQLLGMPFR